MLQAAGCSRLLTGLRRASEAATDRITRCFCNRRVVLTRCPHASCVVNNVRRAQDCSPSRNTELPSTRSPKPPTKHSSAFVGSAVSKNASQSMPAIFSVNTVQSSLLVAYARVLSVEIGLVRRTVLCPLSSSFAPLHRPTVSVSGAQCLNNFLRTSGQNSLVTLKKVSRAICCPHLSAVFPNDRSEAG